MKSPCWIHVCHSLVRLYCGKTRSLTGGFQHIKAHLAGTVFAVETPEESLHFGPISIKKLSEEEREDRPCVPLDENTLVCRRVINGVAIQF